MWNALEDFDRNFRLVDAVRRQLWGEDGWRSVRCVDHPFRATKEPEGIRLEVDLPGITSDDVEVSLENNVLAVKASRKLTSPEGYKVHRRERSRPSIMNTFRLASTTAPERVSCRLTDGVLTVFVGKTQSAEPHRIQINAG